MGYPICHFVSQKVRQSSIGVPKGTSRLPAFLTALPVMVTMREISGSPKLIARAMA